MHSCVRVPGGTEVPTPCATEQSRGCLAHEVCSTYIAPTEGPSCNDATVTQELRGCTCTRARREHSRGASAQAVRDTHPLSSHSNSATWRCALVALCYPRRAAQHRLAMWPTSGSGPARHTSAASSHSMRVSGQPSTPARAHSRAAHPRPPSPATHPTAPFPPSTPFPSSLAPRPALPLPPFNPPGRPPPVQADPPAAAAPRPTRG
jgi:hypothetical protein